MNEYIDHTLLKPDASISEIKILCQQAKEYQFKSVCIPPCYLQLAKKLLAGSEVLLCTIIGFPLGYQTTATKAFETNDAIALGADEIDMVINISALKNKNDEEVQNDIQAVVTAAQGKTVKVILETCLLTNEEKVRACKLSVAAGAHFVKTSTGFSKDGATVEDIKLMRETVGPTLGVKASGGVRTRQDAEAMIAAGATRIGASASVSLMKDIS